MWEAGTLCYIRTKELYKPPIYFVITTDIRNTTPYNAIAIYDGMGGYETNGTNETKRSQLGADVNDLRTPTRYIGMLVE